MKIYFESQLKGVLWIAKHAKSEKHFKIMREEMDLHHMLAGSYFIHAITASLEPAAMAA